MVHAEEKTSLICLFHDEEQARTALIDLEKAGIAREAIAVMGGDDLDPERYGAPEGVAGRVTLDSLGVPERDLHHLREGLEAGGTLLAVSAGGEQVAVAQQIFTRHRAERIDEAGKDAPSEGVENATMAQAGSSTQDASSAWPANLFAGEDLPLTGPVIVGDAFGGSATNDIAVAGRMAIPLVEEEVPSELERQVPGGERVFRVLTEPTEPMRAVRQESDLPAAPPDLPRSQVH